MRSVNTLFQEWKNECTNGSAPSINAAAAAVKEHITETEELLTELQSANGTRECLASSLFYLLLG